MTLDERLDRARDLAHRWIADHVPWYRHTSLVDNAALLVAGFTINHAREPSDYELAGLVREASEAPGANHGAEMQARG